MTRRIEVEYVTPSCALLRGYGSRDLVVELRKRPPVWATRDRAWVVQPSTAQDVIALAESRGYEVFVAGTSRSEADRDVRRGDERLDRDGNQMIGTRPSGSDPGRGLW